MLLPKSNTSGSCHHGQLKSANPLGTPLPLQYRHAEEITNSSLSAEICGPATVLEIPVLLKVDINIVESLLLLRYLTFKKIESDVRNLKVLKSIWLQRLQEEQNILHSDGLAFFAYSQISKASFSFVWCNITSCYQLIIRHLLCLFQIYFRKAYMTSDT